MVRGGHRVLVSIAIQLDYDLTISKALGRRWGTCHGHIGQFRCMATHIDQLLPLGPVVHHQEDAEFGWQNTWNPQAILPRPEEVTDRMEVLVMGEERIAKRVGTMVGD